MVWLIAFGIILVFIGSIAVKMDSKPSIIVVLFGGVIIGIGMSFYSLKDTPTATDVYQGKTTLEITYKDGVPIDSVVVFKNR